MTTSAQCLGAKCRDLARSSGIAAALTALHAAWGADVLPFGPGRHAIAPASLERSCRYALIAGAIYDRRHLTAAVTEPLLLAGEGLVAVAVDQPAGAPVACDGPSQRAWVRDLAWIRLGCSQALLDDCQRYLAGRNSGQTPLLQHQMVRQVIAQALTRQLEAGAVLAEGGFGAGESLIRWVHEQIAAADRDLARLLGASGFVATGPGRRMYISELLCSVYAGAPPHREQS